MIDRLIAALIEEAPEDAARVLEARAPDEAAALLATLAREPAAALVPRLEAGFAARVLEALAPAEAAAIVEGLAPTAAALPLRRAAPEHTAAVLAESDAGFATQVRALLAAPSRTAAALMDPDAPSLPRDLTTAAALAAVRARPSRFKHYLYVVDRAGILVGVTRLLDLVAAAPEAQLDDVMRAPVVRIHADEVEAAVLAHPGWERFTSLPVVDRGERLVGVLRDDVVRPILARARSEQTGTPMSLALSLAELFWLGLTGVTEGVASVVGREVARPPEEPR